MDKLKYYSRFNIGKKNQFDLEPFYALGRIAKRLVNQRPNYFRGLLYEELEINCQQNFDNHKVKTIYKTPKENYEFDNDCEDINTYAYKKRQLTINESETKKILDLIIVLKKQIGNLIKTSLFHGFQPILVEAALFDPEDKSGDSFYLLLCGSDSNVIEKYLAQVDELIEQLQVRDPEIKGSIVSNPLLYSSPAFYIEYPESIPCKCLKMDKAALFIGFYHTLKNNDNFEILGRRIENFFSSIMEKVLKENMEASLAKADTAILLPIFRPAAEVDLSEDEGLFLEVERYKGGGLFLYGKRKVSFELSNLVINLQTRLNWMITNISNSKIDALTFLRKRYRTQAHELRKLVRFIKKGTPPFILDEIRHYFSTLFAIGSEKIELLSREQGNSLFPPTFTEGNNIIDLLINSFKAAVRIEEVIGWADIGEIHFSIKQFESLVNKKQKRLNLKITSDELKGIIQSYDTKYFFYNALLCVFRNTYRHAEPETAIEVSFDSKRKLLVITNQIKSITTRYKERIPETELSNPSCSLSTRLQAHPGYTKDAIQFFVKYYGCNVFDVNMYPDEKDKFLFRTEIPLPSEVLQ